VGAPQIRNRGTVAGNLITASPANDTIPALMVLEAVLRLRSARGERELRLADFYTGVRRTVMAEDEILTGIRFKSLRHNERGGYLKVALRAAQAISVVNAACVVQCDAQGKVQSARIALGAVAPVVIRASKAEAALIGQELDEESIVAAGDIAAQEAQPIDDVRGSAHYRRWMVRHTVMQLLRAAAGGEQMPRRAASLGRPPDEQVCARRSATASHKPQTTVNGEVARRRQQQEPAAHAA
jgi:carbon-monoxide dehydrogenase medium subunit